MIQMSPEPRLAVAGTRFRRAPSPEADSLAAELNDIADVEALV